MLFNRLLPATIAAVVMLSLPACKKKDDTQIIPPPTPVCRMTTLNADGGTMTIAYDGDGRISKTTDPDVVRTYSYNGSTITIVETDPNAKTGSSVVTLNAAGLATQALERDENDAVTTTNIFEYDANNQLAKITEDGMLTATFTWSNGDMVTENGNAGPTNYTYYTDKASRQGDYIQIIQFLEYGYKFINNAHLVQSINNGTFQETFTYEFDGDGKITKLTINESGSSTPNIYTYLYTCN